MRVVAAVAFFFLLTADAFPGEGDTDIHGFYDMVWFDGQFLPMGELTGGTMEFKADSTWVMAVSYKSLGAPVRSFGGYLADEEKDGCTQFESWPEGSPERKIPNIICNGVLSLRSSGWVAVFKKRQ